MITQENEFDSHRIVFEHQYGCGDIMLNTPLEENSVHRND